MLWNFCKSSRRKLLKAFVQCLNMNFPLYSFYQNFSLHNPWYVTLFTWILYHSKSQIQFVPFSWQKSWRDFLVMVEIFFSLLVMWEKELRGNVKPENVSHEKLLWENRCVIKNLNYFLLADFFANPTWELKFFLSMKSRTLFFCLGVWSRVRENILLIRKIFLQEHFSKSSSLSLP